jgi:hypothetical protein
MQGQAEYGRTGLYHRWYNPVATSDSFIAQRSTEGGESEHIWVAGEG